MQPLVHGPDGRDRCGWAGDKPIMVAYHDDEWGRPLAGDTQLFEKLSLEGFQSGLSWSTILNRRDGFRTAFAGFDPHAVAAFDDDDVERLMQDTGIIRNRMKITAVIGNASALLALQDRDGADALGTLVRRHTPEPRAEAARPTLPTDVPALTAESTALSKALKAAGFRFVGPTTIYALMQSAGFVDDHLAGCWRALPTAA